MIHPYEAASLQMQTEVVVENDPAVRDAVVERNLQRLCDLIDWTVHQSNGRTRLVVTPEYAFTGTYRPRSIPDWLRIALPIRNRCTEVLGQKAREFDLHIAGQLMEVDPDWPGMFFDTAFIIGPSGDVILRYRKHNGPNNLNVQYVAPGDVYTRYVELYGPEGVFPVVDTPIGRLGCLVCYDVSFPEVARCLVLNGAEILVHPTCETLGITRYWDQLKVVRALENRAYFVSADSGPWINSRWPVDFSRGNSMIVNYDGTVLSRASGPGEQVVSAKVDIEALRRARTSLEPHELNPYVQLRTSLYAREYQRAGGWPLDSFVTTPMHDRADARRVGEQTLAAWLASGKLAGPGDAGSAT